MHGLHFPTASRVVRRAGVCAPTILLPPFAGFDETDRKVISVERATGDKVPAGPPACRPICVTHFVLSEPDLPAPGDQFWPSKPSVLPHWEGLSTVSTK